MFKTLCQNAQRERLDLGYCFGLGRSVTEHAREVWNLGDPPAVLLAFELNLERHNRHSSMGDGCSRLHRVSYAAVRL